MEKNHKNTFREELNSNSENTLYLGPNKWGGYDIICNFPEADIGEGICKFHVTDELISEGREMEMYFDSSFVKIEISSLLHVLKIFQSAGEQICKIGIDNSIPLSQDIEKGDYLYCLGDFMFLKDLSYLTKKCCSESFYYDGYNLQLNLNHENIPESWEDFLEIHDLIEDRSELFQISKDAYLEALNITKSAILECKNYLKNLYEEKRIANKQNLSCLHKRLDDEDEYLTRLGSFYNKDNGRYLIVCNFLFSPYGLLEDASIFVAGGLMGIMDKEEVLCPPIFDIIEYFPEDKEIYLIKGDTYTLFSGFGKNIMNGEVTPEIKAKLKNGK